MTQKAPERIWTASTEGKCHVGFDTPSMNYTNEYVRADLAQAPAPVRVKPLVWHEGEEPDEWKSGPYDVWCELGRFQLYYWAIVLGEPHETSCAAKAAAYAHHRARILAALEAPDAGVVAELVEALRGLLALLDAGSLYEPQAYRAREVLAKLETRA